jgi:hypothetical protein
MAPVTNATFFAIFETSYTTKKPLRAGGALQAAASGPRVDQYMC